MYTSLPNDDALRGQAARRLTMLIPDEAEELSPRHRSVSSLSVPTSPIGGSVRNLWQRACSNDWSPRSPPAAAAPRTAPLSGNRAFESFGRPLLFIFSFLFDCLMKESPGCCRQNPSSFVQSGSCECTCTILRLNVRMIIASSVAQMCANSKGKKPKQQLNLCSTLEPAVLGRCFI